MANPTRLRSLLPLTPSAPPAQTAAPPLLKRKRPQVPAACNECRKKKVKCDGVRPTCYMCAVAKVPCAYPVPEGLSQREAQKRKLNQVSKAHEDSLRVLRLLRVSGAGASQDIVKQLQCSEDLDEAIESIADASLLMLHPDGHVREVPNDDSTLRSGGSSRISAPQHLTMSSDGSPSDTVLPVSRWTAVSQDERMLDQLLGFFWTWDDTLSRLIDRNLFTADMRTPSPESPITSRQNQPFCSPLLVNAILAVSCLHSTREQPSSTQDLLKLASRFADCAFDRLEAEASTSSLTLLQGAAILWVYYRNQGTQATHARAENLACLMRQTWSALGLGRDGSNLLQLSGTRAVSDPSVWQGLSCIAWGFYCFFGRMALVSSPHMIAQRPLMMKTFEGKDGLGGGSPISTSSAGTGEDAVAARPEHQSQVFAADCWLCEIIDRFVSDFTKNGTQHLILDSGRCTELYNKLLGWKLSVSDHFTTTINSVLPSVLLLQSMYDFTALKLLETFTRQSGVEFDGRNAASLKVLHASSLMTNLWIYRGLYTLKHEYWAAEQCAFAIHVLLPQRESEPAVCDVISRACCVLKEMGNSGVSGRAAELLRDVEVAVKGRGLRVPPYGEGTSRSPDADGGAPMVIVRGARVFEGTAGGTSAPKDGHVTSVKFGGFISDIQTGPLHDTDVSRAGGGGAVGGERDTSRN